MLNKTESKRIRSLQYKKYREKYGQFIIEGHRLVESAIDSDADIDRVFVSHKFDSLNQQLIQGLIKKRVNVSKLSDAEIQQISQTKSPSGVVAICQTADTNDFKKNFNENWIYLDHVSDPGNLGTILRVALWFNIKNIALSKGCVDPFNPKVVRSGMGAHFGLNIYRGVNIADFQRTSLTIFGADMEGEPIETMTLPIPWVLVMGGEANGLQEETKHACQQLISIPKIGSGESLNVASACSILLYDITKPL